MSGTAATILASSRSSVVVVRRFLVCAVCGGSFEADGRGRPPSTCSDDCRVERLRVSLTARVAGPLPERRRAVAPRTSVGVCVVCAGDFERLDRGTRSRTVCSDTCQAEYARRATAPWRQARPPASPRSKQPRPPGICIQCGVVFEMAPTGRTSLLCSPACRTARKLALARGEATPTQPEKRLNRFGICFECGEAFSTPVRRGRAPTLCSEACRESRARERTRRWYAANPQRAAQYRLANADSIRERNRRYHEADREWASARAARWQAANPERVDASKLRSKLSGADRERAKRRRLDDPEGHRQRQRAFYWADPEARRERSRKWAESNPEKARQLSRRNNQFRRALKRGAASGTRFDAREVFERDGWRCGLCGLPIDPTLSYPHFMMATLDHIVPVSKGGLHTLENTQAAHARCNLSKANRTHPSPESQDPTGIQPASTRRNLTTPTDGPLPSG